MVADEANIEARRLHLGRGLHHDTAIPGKVEFHPAGRPWFVV